MAAKTVEEFLLEFAPNVIERLDELEVRSKRIEDFLFLGTADRPSIETVVIRVNNHVSVLCDYADAVRRAGRAVKTTVAGVAKIMRYLAVIAAAIATIVGVYHYLGFGRAFGQSLAAAANLDERGTFRDYVLSLWHSPELGHFGVLLAFGAVGVCGHYYWRWVTNQITGSLWMYLFRDHPKRTLASFSCIAGWAVWAVDPALTWSQTINLALSTGFAVDVIVNKATAREQQGGNNGQG